MAKRKADALAQAQPGKGNKKVKHEATSSVAKRSLLDDSDSGSSEDESVGGVQLEQPELKINKEFASRFEHNKKREELQQCQFIPRFIY